MDLLTFERIVCVHVVEDAFVKLWSKFFLLFYWWLDVKGAQEVKQGCHFQWLIPCSLMDNNYCVKKMDNCQWGYTVAEVIHFMYIIIIIIIIAAEWAPTWTGFKKNIIILKGVWILEFTPFYHNALHLTRLHCATYYQSASRHKQHEDVTPSSRSW